MKIFPAYAGLNLNLLKRMDTASNIPRIRGVEPITSIEFVNSYEYSPHTRG